MDVLPNSKVDTKQIKYRDPQSQQPEKSGGHNWFFGGASDGLVNSMFSTRERTAPSSGGIDFHDKGFLRSHQSESRVLSTSSLRLSAKKTSMKRSTSLVDPTTNECQEQQTRRWQWEHLDVEAAFGMLNLSLETLQNVLDKCMLQSNQSKADVERLSADRQHLDTEIAQMHMYIEELKGDLSEMHDKENNCQKERRGLEGRLAERDASLEQLALQIESVQKRLDDAKKNYEAVQIVERELDIRKQMLDKEQLARDKAEHELKALQEILRDVETARQRELVCYPELIQGAERWAKQV